MSRTAMEPLGVHGFGACIVSAGGREGQWGPGGSEIVPLHGLRGRGDLSGQRSPCQLAPLPCDRRPPSSQRHKMNKQRNNYNTASDLSLEQRAALETPLLSLMTVEQLSWCLTSSLPLGRC